MQKMSEFSFLKISTAFLENHLMNEPRLVPIKITEAKIKYSFAGIFSIFEEYSYIDR